MLASFRQIDARRALQTNVNVAHMLTKAHEFNVPLPDFVHTAAASSTMVEVCCV